jgi:putative FmdB family regulatory protein
MPTYEYECSKGHVFEVEQPITAEALKRCKVCRAKVRRLISASHFILKGSGWYADGYGSSKKSSDSSSETKSESKSDTKSETKSEAKSESTSEAKPGSKSESKPAKSEKSKSSSKAASGK